MAKRRYSWDEKKIARYLKEGRGQGQRESYRPWLTIQDVPSSGRSTRIHSFKTGREHHLLSDLETGLFLMLDWSEAVTDIREQFPLDREVTRMLAKDMGIIHPRDIASQTDIVMTTDFVADMHIGQSMREMALSVKPALDLDGPRTIEKFELERRYWQRKGVTWHVVTDRDLPKQRIANLKWFHEMQSLEHQIVPHQDYWKDRCEQLLTQLQRVHGGLIQDFVAHLEQACRFAPGEAITALRHLAANRIIAMDLDREFSTRDPINVLKVLRQASSSNRRSA